MKLTSGICIGVKAISELGLSQVGLFGLYQLGKRSGHYRRQLAAALSRLNKLVNEGYYHFYPRLELPDRSLLIDLYGDQITSLYEQADEIVDGEVRLFGGPPVALKLAPSGLLDQWFTYESQKNQVGGQDIKFTWEPGRFGWAITLARAYHISGDERYAQAFWDNTQQFLSSNPPYLGPHWTSGQEVAIRLVALAFAFQIFLHSRHTTPQRAASLTRSLAIHAERIPPTMVYARSQNNNHLITEALGLYTASAYLSDHPLAPRWHRLGWKWSGHAFRSQIEADGTYVQHSTNYHRLMLQAAIWMLAVHDHAFTDEPIPPGIMGRLGSATRWLWKMVDPGTGQVPNLGHNDGSSFLPLTIRPFADYRPVIHAAARAFLQTSLVPKGAWDDLGYWMGFFPDTALPEEKFESWRMPGAQKELASQAPFILLNPYDESWAVLDATQFSSRPAHADQLHVDLWWRGLNLTLDPGTYLYNAPPPWENSLTSAFVHNSVTIDGKEYLLRAGRFLYLDRSKARLISHPSTPEEQCASLAAEHNGYRKSGIIHRRTLTACSEGRWTINDALTGPGGRNHIFRLNWLLPDWEYELSQPENSSDIPGYAIRIRSPYGWVSLKMTVTSPPGGQPLNSNIKFLLARAGQLLYGSGEVAPISGWTSPTYGVKIPALACILELAHPLPVEIESEWTLPHEA